MYGRVLALSLAAILATAQGAMAQDDDLGELTTKKPAKKQNTAAENLADLGRTGVYVGVGATWAYSFFDELIDTRDPSSPDPFELDGFTDGWGFNGRIGRRMHKWYALEMEVEKYQGFNGDGGEVDGWMIGMNGKGYPLHGKFQPFALLGAGYADYELTASNKGETPPPSRGAHKVKTSDGFAMRFGGGLDFYLTQTVVLTTDLAYVLGVGEVNDFDVLALSLGVMYRP